MSGTGPLTNTGEGGGIEAGVRLSSFSARWFYRGRPVFVEALWLLVQALLVRSWLPGTAHRAFLLRLFGGEIGRGVTLKPGLRVKFPWRLRVGNFSWLGEDCWIDNLAPVVIGNNVCVSQGAYLCTGNHDWSDPAFALLISPIRLADGCWVGARCIVGPGVVFKECAVALAGSVVTRSIGNYEIHGGNPARFLRRRNLQSRPAAAFSD
jgi:putative colanic acid biosynthesis acetyltransferase WcaF